MIYNWKHERHNFHILSPLCFRDTPPLRRPALGLFDTLLTIKPSQKRTDNHGNQNGLIPFTPTHPHTHTHTEEWSADRTVGIFLGKRLLWTWEERRFNILLYGTVLIKLQRHLELTAPPPGGNSCTFLLLPAQKAIQTQRRAAGRPSVPNCTQLAGGCLGLFAKQPNISVFVWAVSYFQKVPVNLFRNSTCVKR